MKRLSRFNKFISVLNFLAILLLIAACFVPYIQVENFAFLSFLGLVVPALMVVNILFILYWVVERRKLLYATLSAVLISYLVLGSFYKFGSAEQVPAGDLKVMSYNVRSFNKYEELPSKTVLDDIKTFVQREDPDIICIQEPPYDYDFKTCDVFKRYEHHFFEHIHMEGIGLLGIFSKYPILETGMLNLPKTNSNAIFADVLYQQDTMRIYNVHLESLGITPGQRVFSKKPTDKILLSVNEAFQKQMEQGKVIQNHMESSPHKIILCGDLNNGQYSNVYRAIRGDLQDTFLEAGSGYGSTYLFHGIPFRIDFIFSSEAFEITSHTNYDVGYSDHFPVMGSFKLRGE